MDILLQYLLLGVVQGVTEFLPVSSSAHLVLLQKLFGMEKIALANSLILHLGTIAALFVFFFKDILRALRDRTTVLLVLIVTVITGIIAIAGKHQFEALFSLTRPVAIALIITGIVLVFSRYFSGGKRTSLRIKDALIFGVVQGLAIIPGISRSGITISTLLFRKIDRETSFKFSFIASIPAILGAVALEAKEVHSAMQGVPLNHMVGFVFSFLSGLASLWFLRKSINSSKFFLFGYYCFIVAAFVLLYLR
ncbi:MAG: undecaprenyl-diphosphate phosphatase [Candidatus Omnitrophota bacterium]|jgi:undecaprenyl-diphosphatase|nr:MAG: undecaprenyl-diphosphate phosphatase [Candidatus Omnitrophota bacterium]